MLCTYGSVDDVTFAHNGPYGMWLTGHTLKVTHQGAQQGKDEV